MLLDLKRKVETTKKLMKQDNNHNFKDPEVKEKR